MKPSHVLVFATLVSISSATVFSVKKKIENGTVTAVEVQNSDDNVSRRDFRNRTAEARWKFPGLNIPNLNIPNSNNNQQSSNNLFQLPNLNIPGLSSGCRGLPAELEGLKKLLPPGLANLLNDQNVDAIRNTFTLAGLTVAAASGNPGDIVKLVIFFLSPKNPIIPLAKIGVDILHLFPPNEISRQFPEIEQAAQLILQLNALQQTIGYITSG